MGKQPGLLNRNGTYYYRVIVPVDLVGAYGGKTVIKRSLKTKDFNEAKKRRNVEATKFDAKNEELRKRQISDPSIQDNISERDLKHIVVEYVREADARYSANEAASKSPTGEQLSEYNIELETELQRLVDRSDLQGDEMVGSVGRKVLTSNNIDLPTESYLWPQFMELMRRALIEIAKRSISRSQGDYSETHFDFAFDPAMEPGFDQGKLAGSLTFGELCRQYLEEYNATRSVTARTQKKIGALTRFLVWVIGEDTSLHQIDRAYCRGVRDKIGKLPPNIMKNFRDKSVDEVIRLASEQDLEPMKFATQADRIRMLGTVLEWASSEGRMKPVNFKGIEPIAFKEALGDRRHPFTSDQLQEIFRAPIYTGCVNDGNRYAIRGENIIRRSRFWVPLIALFSGMRLGEICQMNVDDVKVTDRNIHFFHVVPDDLDKSVKTKSSWRKVPIHPKLLDTGLLEYIASLRDRQEVKLFPDLTVGSTGNRGATFSKWFNAGFLPKVLDKNNKLNFHSFRHTFRDALRVTEAPDEVVNALGGWKKNGNTSENYGSGYAPDQLFKYVAQIDFPDLDFSHLYVSRDEQ